MGLQYALWFSHGGVFPTRHLQHDIQQQTQINAQLQARNDKLLTQIKELKSGSVAVETEARNELGMIKPGETFYQVAH